MPNRVEAEGSSSFSYADAAVALDCRSPLAVWDPSVCVLGPHEVSCAAEHLEPGRPRLDVLMGLLRASDVDLGRLVITRLGPRRQPDM